MTGLEELDEADIEEEIRRELEALNELDLNSLESFSDSKHDSTQTNLPETETTLTSEEKYGLPPDSVETFIKLLRTRNDKLQEDLADAEDTVWSVSQRKQATVVSGNLEDDEINITSDVKKKVLSEIERDDQSEETIVTIDDELISSLEELALKNLKEFEAKQDKRSDQLNSLFNEIKEDDILRHEKEEKMREENLQKANEEHKIKMKENQRLKVKINEEAKLQEMKLQDLQKQFELEIKDLEHKSKEEKLALEKMKSEERRKRESQKELASITIQKNFRMYRVQSKYEGTLKIKRNERQKRRQDELEALKQKEIRMMEEAVEKAKEEEMRRVKELEMEKKRKEEEEKKRLEDERRRAEEEEMKRKLEEERKIEEERKMKEEMERKQEEERKRKVEIERKIEEERLERERQEREEQERKLEEKKKREDEERRRIEEERKLKEERKRLEEQRKLEEQKEMKEKRLQEQRELERQRLEEQNKLKDLEDMKRGQNDAKEGREEEKDFLEVKVGQEMDKEKSKQCLKVKDRSREQGEVLQQSSAKKDFVNETQDLKVTNNVLITKDKVNISKIFDNTFNVNESSELYSEWETRRQNWLKQTVLWSAASVDEKVIAKSRSKPRRPLSASQKLPSISEEELLKSQKKQTPLHEIVCINVKDLPPRNLKIMSRCQNVISLTIQNCSLLSAEGFDNCKRLTELNLSDNSIQHICCQNMESLECLDLRNNQLTSIHGLDGCHSLRSLHLDGNKITRLGTFVSNKVIHLSLQANQLITTKGLSSWKYLKILDCSNNHLSQIQELESCPFLRILKLRGNNLRKPPNLTNHVLLRELNLGENSISSLEGLFDQWLPHLQHLYVDNNSLSSVCSLRNFPMLETLDIKNNLVSDEENLVPGLSEYHHLQRLVIQGNPVCEDSNIRRGIIKTLPNLKFLDEESLDCVNKNSDTKTIFHPICRAQIIAEDNLLQRQKAELRKFQTESDDGQIAEKLILQSRHFQELDDLMTKHRVEHEQFKITDATKDTTISPSLTLSNKPDIVNEKNEILDESSSKDISISSTLSQELQIKETCNKASVSPSLTNKGSDENETAKSTISVKDPVSNNVSHIPSSCIDNARRRGTTGNSLWTPKQHQAATLIQARFRGYRIRRRYLEAMKSARYSDNDLETEDFDFDEEVDLNMFDMDEAALDRSWIPSNNNFPRTERETDASRDSPPRQELTTPEKQPLYQEDGNRPFPRKQAWRSPDSPLSTPNPRKVIPPIEAPSVLSEQTSPPGETQRSHKTSELSSEWGFSKNSTAELMLKRANRMKYNALRKKKLTDPDKRFQLFKKADETNKARGVKTVQKRKDKPRMDYFSGRLYGDHEMAKKEDEESQAKKEMTFSWVYDQAVLHKDQGEEILKDTGEYYSESKTNKTKQQRSQSGVSLPKMDPVILAGRNLPLVASPVSNPRTASMHSGDVEIGSYRKYGWQQTRTHSNPDLTRVGLSKENRSVKSNSAEARIIKERNHILS